MKFTEAYESFAFKYGKELTDRDFKELSREHDFKSWEILKKFIMASSKDDLISPKIIIRWIEAFKSGTGTENAMNHEKKALKKIGYKKGDKLK